MSKTDAEVLAGNKRLFTTITKVVTEFLNTRPEVTGPIFSLSHTEGRSAIIYIDPVMRGKETNYCDRVALQIIAKWRLPHEGVTDVNGRNNRTTFEVHYGHPTHATHCTVDDPEAAFREFIRYNGFIEQADVLIVTVCLNSPIGPAAILKGKAYPASGCTALEEDTNALLIARALSAVRTQ
jgi:hypothetical protein